jgi:hypothetical protein
MDSMGVFGIMADELCQLERAVQSDPTPATRSSFGPHISDSIGRMTAKVVGGASQLVIGIAGGLLAQAIWVYYAP